MNLSIVILPHKVLADGQHKIRIAISHNSETRYKVTRFKVPSPKNVKNGRVVGKDISNAEYINTQLNAIVQRMYKVYDQIQNAECYTCAQLLEMIEARINTNVPTTFKSIADEWLTTKTDKSAAGSMDIYRKAIECFLEYAGESFLMALLTPIMVAQYERHLSNQNAHKKNGEETSKKLSATTINIRMRNLIQITRYAEKRKYVSYEIDPFIDYHVQAENIRDAFLSVDTLRKIRDFQTDDENVAMARDLFLLSFYLCGMNLEDILTLDFRDDYVSFMRGKTASRRKDGTKTEFTIQPEAREIINRHIMYNGRLHFCGKTKKHTVSNYFSRHFLKLEKAIGSEKHLIFYCARKTFSQLAYRLKIQEMVIRYCIGDSNHTRDKDMLMYYTKTERRMADEAIRRVFDFVASDSTEDELYSRPSKS